MSRTRIVGGVYTKITGGDYKMYTGGDTIITAAGKNDFANAENIIIGTDPEKAPLLVMNDPESINFLVHFKTTDNYDYSFGFDWMRKKYRRICKNYKALKQEYVPVGESTLWKPKGKEYFTPWVCMHKGQKNVRLKIEIEVLNRKGIKDNDIIVLPQQNGISFSLDEINVNEIISKGFVEVEVCCDTVSEEDRLFLVLDKWKNTVGKLNFFKNKTTYQLDVRFVEVKFKGSMIQYPSNTNSNNRNEDINQVLQSFIEKNTIVYSFDSDTILTSNMNSNPIPIPMSQYSTIGKWKKYIEDNNLLSAKLLNQALIKYNPIIKEGRIDYKELIVDLGNTNIIDKYTGTPFNGVNVRNSFIKLNFNYIECNLIELVKALGIIYSNQNPNEKGAIVFLLPITFNQGKAGIFNAYSDSFLKKGKFIILTNNNNVTAPTLVHEIAHTLGLVHSFQKDEFDEEENVTAHSKYRFKELKTENIMDYSKETISFWKWQWEEMQKDDIDLVTINN